jgi:hypothetical protein
MHDCARPQLGATDAATVGNEAPLPRPVSWCGRCNRQMITSQVDAALVMTCTKAEVGSGQVAMGTAAACAPTAYRCRANWQLVRPWCVSWCGRILVLLHD